MSRKYAATGPEGKFEPGSRGRVLRNLLGITRVRDINEAESQALELAQDAALDQQDAALDQYGPSHRFTAKDIRTLHRLWLGPIYPCIHRVAQRMMLIWRGRWQRCTPS
jgi:cell filamentation protein